MRANQRGLTFKELLVVIAVIALELILLMPRMTGPGGQSRRVRCGNHLRQIAEGMITYCTGLGDDRFYPCPLGRGAMPGTYNGAEWLAALYWTRVVPDPQIFLCPSSRDLNYGGGDIGSRKPNDCGGTFSSQTISYASLWWKSLATVNGGPIAADFPPNEPMACDDTQGGVNHGSATNGGMNILFFDSHVEFKTAAEVDITSEHGSVGQGFPNPPKTLLWRLKN